MHLTSLSALFATTLFAFASVSDAVLPGTWPPLDQAPPMKPEWAKLVNKKKLPKAPVQTAQAANCSQAVQFCIWSCNACTRSESDVTACPNDKEWGISYDDGPSPYTPALLDFLNQTNTKVTFAVVGSRVVERPEVLQRIRDEGHEIVVHTWSHPALTTISTEQIIAEIKWTELAIQTAIGLTPKYLRPPRGDYDDRVRSIATQLGYKILMWDRDTFDWKSAEDSSYQPSWIWGNFSQWVTDSHGHISLEHDLYPVGAQNAPYAISIVREAGYTIKPVSVCTGTAAYRENVQLAASGPLPADVTLPDPPAPSPTDSTSGSGPESTSSTNDTSANAQSTSDSYASSVSPQFSRLGPFIILTISIAFSVYNIRNIIIG
ncbi:331_t:CDS:2 [Paraglomus occultum]|uniref:331_t:CDS:1 n=1 Tax=Paraglomus occultum TaxID=144539 RepID=A0A9N8W8V7_9GLOM|nr:331_t:CDS:2 [Paraglomus occultum]